MGGSAPSVRSRAAQLRGATIDNIQAVGKHLIVEFDGGWALHVHLGMTGRWRIGPPTGVRTEMGLPRWCWRRVDGQPVVTGRRRSSSTVLPGYGIPSSIWVLTSPLAHRTSNRSSNASPMPLRDATVSDVLLDQSIASGIGNVYRNEVLFEAGVHPEHDTHALDSKQLAWIYRRASEHLRLNVGRSRTTTGGRRRGSETYVYGRAGRPCRRCGASIRQGRSTNHERTTYWCPSCQPDPRDSCGPISVWTATNPRPLQHWHLVETRDTSCAPLARLEQSSSGACTASFRPPPWSGASTPSQRPDLHRSRSETARGVCPPSLPDRRRTARSSRQTEAPRSASSA